MENRDILTSTQCDDAERCINLEDLTFQSTILAEIDTEENGSEEPISKKSKYCMESSDDSSEEPELREVCLYTLKRVIRNKFGGPLFKYKSSNGFSYNYYVERTTKK